MFFEILAEFWSSTAPNRMSLEPYCLAIRYQSSKTKWYNARHYGLEEITDIIFPRISRNRNIASETTRHVRRKKTESVKVQGKLSETKDEIIKYLDQMFSK